MHWSFDHWKVFNLGSLPIHQADSHLGSAPGVYCGGAQCMSKRLICARAPRNESNVTTVPPVVPKCLALFKLLLLKNQQWTWTTTHALDTSSCANLLLRQLILKMMLACPAVAFWAWNVEMMAVVVLVVLAPLRLSWVGWMWLLGGY